MILNISYDEVRHSQQFAAMIEAIKTEGGAEALCFQPNPERHSREDLQTLHQIMRLENELLHRYLKHVILKKPLTIKIDGKKSEAVIIA